MKHFLFSFFFLTMSGLSANAQSVEINETNFPNETFRTDVANMFDSDGDGWLSEDEIANAKEINMGFGAPADVEGIRYLTSLETLLLNSSAALTTLDIHGMTSLKILVLGGLPSLESINAAGCTALEIVRCQYDLGSLRSVDFSTCPSIQELKLRETGLTSFDASGLENLTKLEIEGPYKVEGKMASIDVSHNPKLKFLYCGNNQLATLNLSANTELTTLSCKENKLTALDLSANTKLTYLYCEDNQLTAINLSANTELTELYCSNNQLTSLDLSANTKLTELRYVNNQLTTLDLSANTKLTKLDCSNNQLTALDLSVNTDLRELYCSNNKLTALDLSVNTDLRELDCSNNQLTALDLSVNTYLKGLYCSQNHLTTLNVSGAESLERLYCENNRLTTLLMPQSSFLRHFDCYNNCLDKPMMDDIISCLPYCGEQGFRVVDETSGNEGNICTSAHVAAAKANGWVAQSRRDGVWMGYLGLFQPQTGSAFKAPVTCGDGTVYLTFTVTNTQPWEVEVSQGDATIAGELIIPATVTYNDMTFAVKAVKGEGFMTWNYTPYSVVLPEGLTTIWDRGFSSSNVTAVTLPSTLTDIYQGAFMNCTSLADITLPEGLTKITLASFQNTPSLKSINLSEGITTIEDNAFRKSGLESIKFPTTLTYVGIAAFRECALKTLDFNGCTAEIDAEAFIGTSIEELNIPETIMLKGWTNFGWCQQLKTVEMRNMNQTAHHDVFKACSKLETVILPHVDVMTHGYLIDCPNLQSVTFLSGDAGDKPYFRNFSGTPADVLFTVPEGTAESFLKKGYRNLSDKSGLPLVKAEFEAEVARITAMADGLSNGDKTALNAAISEARTAVQATDDYLTVYAQIEATKSAAKTYLTTATLTRDFDVTAATIVNPDMDCFHLGWQLGWAANGGYKTGAFTNGDVAIENFVESYPDTEGNIFSQTIKRLPAGIYRLEADIIAANQHDASATVTGVSLFAGSERTAVATEDQKPQHFSVKFVNPRAKDVTVGINVTDGTNASWVAMDNVRLIYDGKAADIPQGVDLASDENARVYLYNVETGKYLSAGHAYGKHAILDSEGLPLRLTKDEETDLWQIYFWEGSFSQQLLFRDEHENDANVWVDYNGQGDDLTWWNITEAGDGSYLIQNKTLLDTESYLGNDPTHQDLQREYTGVSHSDVIATASSGQNSHWLLFSKEQGEQLSAKSRLLAAIMRMETSGTANAELLASAQAVYDDAAATTTEVVAATTQLNSQMGMPTQDAPIDMTALIVNPRFENNTTEGWTGATVVGGRADATSNQEQEFYETDFNMYQTITGVPNGRYRLAWKGFHRPGPWRSEASLAATFQTAASAVVYANAEQKTMKHIKDDALTEATYSETNYDGLYIPSTMEQARQYFDAGLYADYLDVDVTDNTLTIGVKNTEPMASNHWVIFSDFELSILENEEQQNNRIVVSDVQGIAGGRTSMPVVLKSEGNIVSFSFDVKLPEGVTPVVDSDKFIEVKKNSRIPMVIRGSVLEDGTCRFVAMPNGESITAGKGNIFAFSIQMDKNMELGDYECRIGNVKLVTEQMLRIQPFDTTSLLTIKEPGSGDVNGDGEVDIMDATIIVYYMLGRTTNLNLTVADVNGDGEVDILDPTIIIYQYVLGRSANAAKTRPQTLPDPQ